MMQRIRKTKGDDVAYAACFAHCQLGDLLGLGTPLDRRLLLLLLLLAVSG